MPETKSGKPMDSSPDEAQESIVATKSLQPKKVSPVVRFGYKGGQMDWSSAPLNLVSFGTRVQEDDK